MTHQKYHLRLLGMHTACGLHVSVTDFQSPAAWYLSHKRLDSLRDRSCGSCFPGGIESPAGAAALERAEEAVRVSDAEFRRLIGR